MTEEELKAFVQGVLANLKGSSSGNSTTNSSDYLKLTKVSARELLRQTAANAQYTGELSDADVKAFMEQFNAESARQVESVIKQARASVGAGATKEDIQSLISTSFPSFFKPADLANDFIWGKVNFKESATLGGKAANALQQARQVASDFDLFSLTDLEVELAAKDIAMGKKTIAEFKSELASKAAIEYPVFASRYAEIPGATTKDFAMPVINMLSKIWEQDANSIPMDNEIVQKWTRAGGPDGKQPIPTLAELTQMAKNHPNAEKTTWANEAARQSATSLARALGAGF